MSKKTDDLIHKVIELEKQQHPPHPAFLSYTPYSTLALDALLETQDPDQFVGIMMRLAAKYYSNSQPLLAEQVMDWSLGVIFEAEKFLGRQLHKGSLFYFWAIFALDSGQFDWAFILMHKALKEDQISNNDFTSIPNSPAAMFVTLDASTDNQFAYATVKNNRRKLENFLYDMNGEKAPSNLSDFLSACDLNAWEQSIQFVFVFLQYLHLVQTRRYGLCDTPFGLLYLQRLESDIVTLVERACGDLSGTHLSQYLALPRITTLNSVSNKAIHDDETDGRSNRISHLLENENSIEGDFALVILLRNHVNHRNERLENTLDEHLHIMARILGALAYALHHNHTAPKGDS